MPKPQRVQLKRQRGWKMPPNTVKVDRSTIYGNPFSAEQFGRETAVALHRGWLSGVMTDAQIAARFHGAIAKHLTERRHEVMASLGKLRGKNLGCWCPDEPCHATLLLELANRY